MELKTFLKRLLKIVDIEKKKYIVNQIKCFSFLMIYTIASVIFPSFLSKIVDLGVVMGDVSNIVLYTTEMLICGILMVIFYYLQKVFFFKFGNDIVLRTKQKLYKKLNTVDIQFWNQYKVGDVLTILDNDIEKLQELLTSDISELVVNICLCIGISSYIIILNPKIGILVVVMSIIFAFIQRKVANKSKERMKKLRVTMGDFNSFSTETINNMPSLQMTGKTQYIKKMYADKCDELAKEGLDFTKTMCTVGMTGMSFNVLAIVIVLILGAVDVSNNLISVGLLFSMTIYVQRLYSPIVSIGNMFVKIKNFFPLLDNIYNVMFNENNKANQYSPVVTAVAMSTKTWKKKYLPTHCLIPAVKVKVTDTDFEVFDSMALCEQIVSIDVNVQIERVVASISDTELLDKITECVKIQIGAYEKYN